LGVNDQRRIMATRSVMQALQMGAGASVDLVRCSRRKKGGEVRRDTNAQSKRDYLKKPKSNKKKEERNNV